MTSAFYEGVLPSAVLGPAWSTAASALIDAGRFPLGVETATIANAARLVPLVNSGTAHARYYLLHAAVAAQSPAAPGKQRDLDKARTRVRRAEVVLAAATLQHAQTKPRQHTTALPYRDPHGTRTIRPALDSGHIDIAKLAKAYSKQTGGFLAVYRGAEIEAGLLGPMNGTLVPGPVRVEGRGLEGVNAILEASENKLLSLVELDQLLPHGCLCQVRRKPEATLIAHLLFGDTETSRASAPAAVRQARLRTATTARLLLHALDGQPADTNPTLAMAALCLDEVGHLGDSDLIGWALSWRGALLRNASVTAWRWLWWWLTDLLNERPRSRQELADAFAEALVDSAGRDGNAVKLLRDSLPRRKTKTHLLDAENELLYSDGAADPWTYLHVLMLGAQRLDDLDGRALDAFLEHGQLGPMWVRDWFAAHNHLTVSDLGRTLAAQLLTQAEEISRQRIRWEGGQLRLPTRLREIGDVLDLAGEEGSEAPGLRLRRLRQMLEELGFLTLHNDVLTRGSLALARWAP